MVREYVSGHYLQHLIDASHRKSLDPYKEIDWSVPFDYSHFYMPQDMVSLYGTPIWDEMTREQKVRLSMHEASSALATTIWFENQTVAQAHRLSGGRQPARPGFLLVKSS